MILQIYQFCTNEKYALDLIYLELRPEIFHVYKSYV